MPDPSPSTETTFAQFNQIFEGPTLPSDSFFPEQKRLEWEVYEARQEPSFSQGLFQAATNQVPEMQEIVSRIGKEWLKVRADASREIKIARKTLRKLQEKRGEHPPSQEELNYIEQIDQLKLICQQIDAQFNIVDHSVQNYISTKNEVQSKILRDKTLSWYGLSQLGLIDRQEFWNQWFQLLGFSLKEQTDKVRYYIGATEKEIEACRIWQNSLIFPRKISSILEVGSGIGRHAFLLNRMLRVGAIEKNPALLKVSQTLDKMRPHLSNEPTIGLTDGMFQPGVITQLPVESFDAIWFHQSIWHQWLQHDGPELTSGLANLARCAHYLLLSTQHERPDRESLLTPLYHISFAGEQTINGETTRYFIAKRRFLQIGKTQLPCGEMRIHDSFWQGCDKLTYSPTLLSYNQGQNSPLPIRRFVLHTKGCVLSILNRTHHFGAGAFFERELGKLSQLQQFQIPEIPKIENAFQDPIGYHLLLNPNIGTSLHFPTPILTENEETLLLRSALNLLRRLRQEGLHLNFLRLGNFLLGKNKASHLGYSFISPEEIEDPHAAFLWLLHDFTQQQLRWHDCPIEPFPVNKIKEIAPHYQEIAYAAFKASSLDEFLQHPSLEKFLS